MSKLADDESSMQREQFSGEYQTGLRKHSFQYVRGRKIDVLPPRSPRRLRRDGAQNEILAVKSRGRDYESRPAFRATQVGEWERNQNHAPPS
jgi:hypothetical protein